MIYDLIIVGSGPAGLCAAIYAQRARLNTLVIEQEMVSGGQVLNTYEVDNYPGLPGIGGYELGTKFREHAEGMGVVFAEDEIVSLEDGPIKRLQGMTDVYEAKTVLIATGAVHRKLGIPGEERLSGMGVSYCAVCDGAFFRGKDVAVVGGGNVATEDAVFLSRLCRKVYLIHRRDKLRAEKGIQEAVFAQKNIEVLWSCVAEAVNGKEVVESLSIKWLKTGQSQELPVSAVFMAVGIVPKSQAFEGIVEMEDGYIKAGEDGVTSAPGIFAAGDVRTKVLRQIITAASDGANAAVSAQRYLDGE